MEEKSKGRISLKLEEESMKNMKWQKKITEKRNKYRKKNRI